MNVLKTVSHPNVVRYYESFVYKERLCIVMDYAENGDLQKKVKKAKKTGVAFPEEDV